MAFVPREIWAHRSVMLMDAAQRLLLVHLLDEADAWGRVPLGDEVLLDVCDMVPGMDEDHARAAVVILTKGRRPFIHPYADGRWGQVHGHDKRSSRSYLNNRSLPEAPEPPLDVWRASSCSRRCSANRQGEIKEGIPGWYPHASHATHATHATHARAPPHATHAAIVTAASDEKDTGGLQPHATHASHAHTTTLHLTPPHNTTQRSTTTSASVADAPRAVLGWRDEVADLMGTDAPAVIAIVERVADARGFGTDPLIVWQDGRTVLKAAGGLPHFGFALAGYLKKLDDGSAKTYGGAPWGWLRSVAGNGPMGNNSNQQRSAPVPYQHETNRRQAAGESPPIVDLPPGEGSDVGVSTW